MKYFLSLVLFLGLFALYLGTMPGTLAPYRDAGEMVVSSHTLGVSHPPGYPLYILLGRLAQSISFARPAYTMNVLSVLAGVLAVCCLFLFLAFEFGILISLAAALLLAANFTFWHASNVQEMYSLNILFAVLALWLASTLRHDWSERRFILLAFMTGICLGNRMDFLLLFPALAFLAFPDFTAFMEKKWSLLRGLLFFVLGLSVFLYLPIRSMQLPWLDWNHPATLERLFASVTRKGYGGTLDLLSKHYAAGEMFFENIRYYGIHVVENFTWIGLAVSLMGFFKCILSRQWWVMAGFFVAGPLFLFLANMPPNPHALAIVEAHYLLPDLILVICFAEGLKTVPGLPFFPKISGMSQHVEEKQERQAWHQILGIACVIACLGLLSRQAFSSFRRHNMMAVDFADNTLRVLPPGSILVAKEDVQLFSLWHAQEIQGKRRDVAVVAQGLSGSSWYKEGMMSRHSELRLFRVKSPDAWERFLLFNRGPVFASQDADLPDNLKAVPFGISSLLGDRSDFLKNGDIKKSDLSLFWVIRGPAHYEEQTDFFSSDLIEGYVQALHRLGAYHEGQGDSETAESCFWRAWTMKRRMPDIPLFLGYIRFKNGRNKEAARFFKRSAGLYEKTLGLASFYHTLPDVVRGIEKASANAYLNWGAVSEKLGDRDLAERCYVKSLERNPNLAGAHYNLAVLYWGRDRERVKRELRETLRIQPDHPAARKYLGRLTGRPSSAE